MGDGGYRSIQATLVYSFCFILHYCGPSPTPPLFTIPSKNKRVQEEESSSSSKKKKKKKNKPTQPGKGEEWTKEMYEQRRKEKKVKSRGVSGRSKKEIFADMSNGGNSSGRSNSRDEQFEQSMTIFDPEQQQQQRSSRWSGSSSRSHSRSHHSDPKYDEYVDTEPDGMDWSAYTPEQRDAYYERQRAKKRERKEREREKKEREKMRQWEDDGLGDPYGDSGRSPRSPGGDDAYSVIEYDDNGRRYSDDYSRRHEDSYYSDRDGRRKVDYDMPPTHSPSSGRGGGGEYYDDEYDSMVDGGTNADYSDRDYRSRGDDYTHDEYGGGSRYEDDYRSNRDPDVYYDEEESPHSSSRQSTYSRSHSGGRSRGTDRSSRHNDSYYSRDSYDRSRQSSSYRDPYV